MAQLAELFRVPLGEVIKAIQNSAPKPASTVQQAVLTYDYDDSDEGLEWWQK